MMKQTTVSRLLIDLVFLVVLFTSPLAVFGEAMAGEGEKLPIRVGVTVGLTGPYEVPARAQLEGIQMWVHDINQRGALLGRRVELVYYDDESDPLTSGLLYERLINEDKVDLLIGPYGSDITMAASDVAEKYQFPMVAAGAAGDRIWARGYRNIFGVDDVATHYMNLLVELAARAGLKTIALLYADSEFPRGVAEGTRARAAEHGMQIVFDQEYSPQSADYAQLVKGVKAAQPELFIGGTYLDDSIAIAREAKRQNFSPKAMAFTVGPALREFITALGDDANGIMGVVAWMRSAAMPMAMDFSYRYKIKFGGNASVQAALGYGAAQVLEAAVRLAGSLNKDAIRQQLREMKFQSLVGRYKVDETGRQTAKTTYVMQIQNGFRLLVLPKELRDAPVQYPFTPWSER